MNDSIDNQEYPGVQKDPKGSDQDHDFSTDDLQDFVISPDDSSKVQEGSKENAGVVLKRSREAQGLSLEIVHEATKIPLDALRAIEEGYKVRMLSTFYYKGFVKMYASYLGVEVSEVIEDYREEELPQHIDPDVEGFEMPEWVSKVFTRQRKQQIVIVVGGMLGLFLITKLFGAIFHRPKVSEPKKTVKAAEVKKSSVAEKEVKSGNRKDEKKKTQPVKRVEKKITVKNTPMVVTRSEPAPLPSTASTIQKNIILTVRAKENSWLRVKTDGDTVFQSTLRTGAVETWLADNSIEISGGNISQLEFDLNGKLIGALGRKDRNAKRVVITKDGLSVKK